MTGVVLCGGESSRMGRDKGLLTTEPEITEFNRHLPWALAAAEKLASLSIPVYLSIAAKQRESYAHLSASFACIEDNEMLDLKGPLLGILSAHRKMPQQDLMVLACDMLQMSVALLKKLSAQYDFGYAEAVVYRLAGQPEPLAAIYAAPGLRRIFKTQQAGHLHKHSMKYILDQLRTQYIDLAADEARFFINANTRQDLGLP